MYNEIDELQKSVKSLEREVHSMWKAIGILQIIADNIDLKNNDKSTREEVEQRVFILGKAVSRLQVAIDNQDLKNRQYDEQLGAIEKLHKQYEGWKNAINKDISTLYSECHEISFNPKSDDKSLNCKKQDAIKIINDIRSNIDSILKDIK